MESPKSFSATLGGVGSRVKWDQGIMSVSSGCVSTRAALRGMVDMCQQKCKYHEQQSDHMRIIEFGLQIPMLLLTAMTTVMATIIPVADLCSMEPQITLALMSAVSTILASILRLYDPGVRREEHKSCERMYRSLARDVAIRLVTFDDDAIGLDWSYLTWKGTYEGIGAAWHARSERT